MQTTKIIILLISILSLLAFTIPQVSYPQNEITQVEPSIFSDNERKEETATAKTDEPNIEVETAIDNIESVPEPKIEEDTSEPPSLEEKAHSTQESETEPQTSAEKKYLAISNSEKADVFGKPNVFASKTGALHSGQKIEYVELVNSFYEIVQEGKKW